MNISNNNFSNCPIGMQLYSNEIGPCVVVKFGDNNLSRIVVQSLPNDHDQIYTRPYFVNGGNSINNGPQVLFYNKPQFEPPRPNATQIMEIMGKELTLDQPILVKSHDNWTSAHFANHWTPDGKGIGVWQGGQTSWTANGVVHYFLEWVLPEKEPTNE